MESLLKFMIFVIIMIFQKYPTLMPLKLRKVVIHKRE